MSSSTTAASTSTTEPGSDKPSNEESASFADANVELLCLSDNPIEFEPLNGLTSVFFDKENQQIFCVRSNGVGGVVAKGYRPELNLSFRMDDRGNVVRIKFSPNMNILAITRVGSTAIDFLNFKNAHPAFPEYSQSFKAKNTKSQDFYWLDTNEILLVSEQGFEHYQIFPEKRALKLLKSYNMALNWLIWSQEAQLFIISTGNFGSVLNPFVYTKGSFTKLPKFEVDLPLPINLAKYRYNADPDGERNEMSPSGKGYFLNESDVVLGRIYGEYYLLVIRQMSSPPVVKADTSSKRASRTASDMQGYSEIAMYKLLINSPAKKTNVLKVQLSGRFILNIIDELIIVHHRVTYSSMIFDIKMRGEFDGYTTCNYPVIEHATIQPPPESVGRRDATRSTQPSPNLSDAVSTTSSQSHSDTYSTSWFMFLPNVVLDSRLGCFWFMQLNLEGEHLAQFRELHGDYLKLTEFLLNRKKTKRHVLKVCEKMIHEKTSLKVVEQVFNKINTFYRLSLPLLNSAINTSNNISLTSSPNSSAAVVTPVTSNDESNLAADLPVVEQYDMHNEILYPLLEDDVWWSDNSAYTIAVLVEYFRSLTMQFILVEHSLYKLLVNALIKSNRLYQLHQYLQYHVLSDSKALACLLLGIEATYPASNQLALDMLKRLGTADEEIIDVLLSKGLLLPAIRYGIQIGSADTLSAKKFLDFAKDLSDPLIFYEVFKFFETRNVRLTGTPVFKSEEACDVHVKHFMELFNRP